MHLDLFWTHRVHVLEDCSHIVSFCILVWHAMSVPPCAIGRCLPYLFVCLDLIDNTGFVFSALSRRGVMYMDSPMPYLTCSSCTPVLDLYHSCMTSHHNGMLAWLGRYFRASCVLPLQLCFPSLQIGFIINVFLLTVDISMSTNTTSY